MRKFGSKIHVPLAMVDETAQFDDLHVIAVLESSTQHIQTISLACVDKNSYCEEIQQLCIRLIIDA